MATDKKPQTSELSQIELKKVPLPDVDFVRLVTSGGPIPETMTAEQKKWLKKFQSPVEDEISEDEKKYVEAPAEAAQQPEPEPVTEAEPEVSPVEETKPDPEQIVVEEETAETGLVQHEDVIEAPTFTDEEMAEADEDPLHGAPPIEFSSKRKVQPDLGTPNLKPHVPPNDAGLYIAPESDDCFNLTKWKGGSCTVQGFRPCPFLGGGQHQCELYKNYEDGMAEERKRRP